MSTSIYFEIQADDLDRAENFYKTIFNWRFKPVPGLPVEYRSIDHGGTGEAYYNGQQKLLQRSVGQMLSHVRLKLMILIKLQIKYRN
jgi:predicted enzyme related to lactoylglutathione lyase